ncbi:MAG: methionine adenosyltransferase [Eubacteriales bacterium]|nr:methionine adenosyltransferase [Eubacteriales bacterium]
MERVFTSESVTIGHPDKMCDQISDAVLDAIIEKDKFAHVACETVTTTGLIMVMGEITTDSWVDIEKIARETTCEIGYNDAEAMFNGNTCSVLISVHQQSPDIAMGVNSALETREIGQASTGAGDQGMMFGFACDETDVLMPLPIYLAHKLTDALAKARLQNQIAWLKPDGKAQVSVVYDENHKPLYIDTVVLSTQHSAWVSHKEIEETIVELIIKKALPQHLITAKTKYLINPTGRFVVGGPVGDSGLTGRKIIVDTYGGYAKHGGGAFSGKDPTKVDRTASYAARHAAKNIVAAGLASKAEVALAYAIGVAKPVSINIETFGTGTIADEKIAKIVENIFDFTPDGMIRNLDLLRPIYKNTAKNGHFGRNDTIFPWEACNFVDKIKEQL